MKTHLFSCSKYCWGPGPPLFKTSQVTILNFSSPDWVKYNERDNFGELSDKSEFMKVMEEFDANVKIN